MPSLVRPERLSSNHETSVSILVAAYKAEVWISDTLRSAIPTLAKRGDYRYRTQSIPSAYRADFPLVKWLASRELVEAAGLREKRLLGHHDCEFSYSVLLARHGVRFVQFYYRASGAEQLEVHRTLRQKARSANVPAIVHLLPASPGKQ